METTNTTKNESYQARKKDRIIIPLTGIVKSLPYKKEINGSDGEIITLYETKVLCENPKSIVLTNVYSKNQPDVKIGDKIPLNLESWNYKIKLDY